MSYTPPKTTRGVQEQDVWAAADAVLAQGQRPTIERVRLQLGRGSPNTVGPMLESWFTRLGARLAQAQQADEGAQGVPGEVLDAMRALWQVAQQQAQATAEAALATAQAEVTQQQEALEQEQARVLRQEEALQQQKLAMEEAWRLAQAQQADLAARYRAGGMGYGTAKKELADLLEAYFAPLRAKRAELAAQPHHVEAVLQAGAAKARAVARETLTRARRAVGLE